MRTGYVRRFFPLPLQPDDVDNPIYADGSTGYVWGSARFNETYLRKRFQASAYITRFQDNFLGGSHEFKAGEESNNLHLATALRTEHGVDFVNFTDHLGPAAARGRLSSSSTIRRAKGPRLDFFIFPRWALA